MASFIISHNRQSYRFPKVKEINDDDEQEKEKEKEKEKEQIER